MEKKHRKIISITIKYVAVFIVSLVFLTLAHHYNDFLGMGRQSWNEILDDIWLYCFGALSMCFGFYIVFSRDE